MKSGRLATRSTKRSANPVKNGTLQPLHSTHKSAANGSAASGSTRSSTESALGASHSTSSSRFLWAVIWTAGIAFVMLIALAVAGGNAFAAGGSSSSTSSSTSSTANNGLVINTALVNINLINQQPDPAAPGDVVDLRIGVVNNGDQPANNLVLEFVPSFPFELLDGESPTVSVGALEPYQGQNQEYLTIVKYQVHINKDASSRSYPVQFKIYQNGSISNVVQQLNLAVASATNGQAITIDKSVLVPGQITNVTFTVHNTGTAPLRSVSFSWSNAAGIILPVGSDNTQYASYIDIGESKSFTYEAVADTSAAAGLYRLDLALSYLNAINGSPTVLNKTAGIYVGGGTDFDVALSESSGGSTSLSVANVGSNPANSVSIIVPQQPGWRVSGSNSAIIGNLNKGDYTVASFNLISTGQLNDSTVPGTASSGGTGAAENYAGGNGAVVSYANYTGRRGRFNASADQTAGVQIPGGAGSNTYGGNYGGNYGGGLLVEIAYTDTMGYRQTVFKEVPISSLARGNTSGQGYGARASQQSSLSTYGWYIFALIVIVAAVYGYRRYKHNKMLADDGEGDSLSEPISQPATRRKH